MGTPPLQAKMSERGGFEKFLDYRGGRSLKKRGENFRGGGLDSLIPGHKFPSISNFIASFSKQMTCFFIFSQFSEVKMRNLVYCFNVTSTFLTFNYIFFNTQCWLLSLAVCLFCLSLFNIQYRYCSSR